MSTRNPTELQRDLRRVAIFLKAFILNPPRTHFLYGDYPESDRCLRTSSLIIVQSVHLTLPHEFRGRSDHLVSRDLPGLRLADSVSPRPARIADQADYGPLHPARATRADLVSSRNLPAGQADHSPLISPVCGSGIDTFIFVQLCKAIEVRGIHHRAILSFHVSNQVETFGISQNTGETLPNFRQKSKEILKRY
ncbi:hypothetical protein Prudu_017772 [Prunus dulcis]|uniref:Uncharacterized protein n=1 Tax=Prunus dulcis TaxID=3755 RepID=A0A4Y1RQG6_PRUDU|nr:hypothetical protein Prudu_017772 [Prunus dulcis]